MAEIEDNIRAAINTYHELNASVIDELEDEPSPLEFMRFVSKNRPFVVRNAAKGWQALNKWDAEYLRRKMEGQRVQVAVTPFGNADAIIEDYQGRPLFVEPHYNEELFGDFLGYIQEDSVDCRGNVKYAQTQNDNLRGEYGELFGDVPKDIPFARIALEQNADAINLWIGNERSTTALHKDNYENIYVQIRGQKHFVLLPPIAMPCVNEQLIAQGGYIPKDEVDGSFSQAGLVAEAYEDSEAIPVAIWDPEKPDQRATPYSHLAIPLRVTLNEGDMLYLPAMWYHKVKQTAGDEGFACAVNYWYDMDFAGGFWTASAFLRDVYIASSKSTDSLYNAHH